MIGRPVDKQQWNWCLDRCQVISCHHLFKICSNVVFSFNKASLLSPAPPPVIFLRSSFPSWILPCPSHVIPCEWNVSCSLCVVVLSLTAYFYFPSSPLVDSGSNSVRSSGRSSDIIWAYRTGPSKWTSFSSAWSGKPGQQKRHKVDVSTPVSFCLDPNQSDCPSWPLSGQWRVSDSIVLWWCSKNKKSKYWVIRDNN